jgi:hypothetical protein
MTDILKQSLDQITAEENRLVAELSRVRSVKDALQRALGAAGINGVSRKRAPAGELAERIVAVLDKREARSNGQIRKAIAADGYAHSLSPLHVTKTLIRLLDAKRVMRVGTGQGSRYKLPGK